MSDAPVPERSDTDVSDVQSADGDGIEEEVCGMLVAVTKETAYLYIQYSSRMHYPYSRETRRKSKSNLRPNSV